MAAKYLPSMADITKQAVIMIAAGLVVAIVLRQFPELRAALNPDKETP